MLLTASANEKGSFESTPCSPRCRRTPGPRGGSPREASRPGPDCARIAAGSPAPLALMGVVSNRPQASRSAAIGAHRTSRCLSPPRMTSSPLSSGCGCGTWSGAGMAGVVWPDRPSPGSPSTLPPHERDALRSLSSPASASWGARLRRKTRYGTSAHTARRGSPRLLGVQQKRSATTLNNPRTGHSASGSIRLRIARSPRWRRHGGPILCLTQKPPAARGLVESARQRRDGGHEQARKQRGSYKEFAAVGPSPSRRRADPPRGHRDKLTTENRVREGGGPCSPTATEGTRENHSVLSQDGYGAANIGLRVFVCVAQPQSEFVEVSPHVRDCFASPVFFVVRCIYGATSVRAEGRPRRRVSMSHGLDAIATSLPWRERAGIRLRQRSKPDGRSLKPHSRNSCGGIRTDFELGRLRAE